MITLTDAEYDGLKARIAALEAALREIATNPDCRGASCGMAAREILGLPHHTAGDATEQPI